MVWFKVDDKLHSHPKTSSASLAAMGLWALAGSWCSDHTTDGRVPSHMIQSLSRGAVELADELVAAGLWVRTKDGYRFHQWLANGDGTKRNPSKKEVEEERRKKSEAGRKGGLASGKTRSKTEARASAGAQARASRLVEPPTRPDHKEKTTSSLSQPDGFDEFWTVYPRRTAKDAGRKAYAAAIKRGANREEVLAGAVAYRDECERERRDQQYIAHASTWLNQGRWKDHLEAPPEPARRLTLWDN